MSGDYNHPNSPTKPRESLFGLFDVVQHRAATSHYPPIPGVIQAPGSFNTAICKFLIFAKPNQNTLSLKVYKSL